MYPHIELRIEIFHGRGSDRDRGGEVERVTLYRNFANANSSPFTLDEEHLKEAIIDLLSGVGFESKEVRKYLSSKLDD